MNETLNSLCWNDRLDFVKQLDKSSQCLSMRNIKKIGVKKGKLNKPTYCRFF